jgi:hypothetical protein
MSRAPRAFELLGRSAPDDQRSGHHDALNPGARRRTVPAVLRRSLISGASVGIIWAALAVAPAIASGHGNPIVVENRHAGSDRWDIPWAGYQITDDRRLDIKGYATAASVLQGHSIGLRITTARHERYTIDVFRLGYYHGKGGRLIAHLGPLAGSPQPACFTVRATGMVTCPWRSSVRLHVPHTWTSGVYFAVLTTPRSHHQSEIMFTVRDRRPAGLVYMSSVNTYQAYNNFPYDPPAGVGWDEGAHPLTGRSLYDFNSPVTHRYPDGKPGVKVSFDRPYSSQYGNPGNGGLTDFEPFLIAFLEKRGYNVTYITDVDTDANPWLLRTHRAVIVAGHSEYWSKRMYDGAYAARDHGVSLAFITSNEIYWQVRFERNGQGRPRRVMVGYKDFRPDPVANPVLRTIQWRDLGRPEQQLSGVQLPTDGFLDWGGLPLVPINTRSWPFHATGLRNGVPLPGELVGYEIDSFDRSYPAPDAVWRKLLAASPFVNFAGVGGYTHNMSIYKAHSGALVWATGTMDWSWALAPGGSSDGTHNNVRPSLQRLTDNVLRRMLRNRS